MNNSYNTDFNNIDSDDDFNFQKNFLNIYLLESFLISAA